MVRRDGLKDRGDGPKEQIHLKADADIGDLEGVGALRVWSEGLMYLSGWEERKQEGIFLSSKGEHETLLRGLHGGFKVQVDGEVVKEILAVQALK